VQYGGKHDRRDVVHVVEVDGGAGQQQEHPADMQESFRSRLDGQDPGSNTAEGVDIPSVASWLATILDES